MDDLCAGGCAAIVDEPGEVCIDCIYDEGRFDGPAPVTEYTHPSEDD